MGSTERPVSARQRSSSRGLQDRYGLVLSATLLMFVITAVASEHAVGRVLAPLLFTALLVLVLVVSKASRRAILVTAALIPIAIAASVVAGVSEPGTVPSLVGIFLSAILIVVSSGVIVRRIATRRYVSISTVLGALCVYLFLAVLFSFVYRMISILGSEPLFAQTDEPASIDFIYFSLVSLTTLGFGDLTPLGSVGKMTAVLEAVLGQLYLVTVVAVFVGNLSRRQKEVLAVDDAGSAPADDSDPDAGSIDR